MHKKRRPKGAFLRREDRIRTCDPLVPNQMRYHLRHFPRAAKVLLKAIAIELVNSLPHAMGLLVWTDFSRLLNTVGLFKTIELS
jgi:hypothetical protein